MARLTKTDWIRLGQKLLKESGPSALTLEALTTAANKTRGSFYHHFKSRDAFLGAMIDDWQETSFNTLAIRLQAAGTPEAQREIMRKVSLEWDAAFERQLRFLAAQEPVVAVRLEQVDALRMRGLATMVRLLKPEIVDPDAFAFIQYASIVGGQMLLKSGDDKRIPAILDAGNNLFGLN